MNVLHIMSGFGGGISSFILNKAKYFQRKEVVFDVITFDHVSDQFLSTIQGTGGRVYQVSNPKLNGFSAFSKQVNQIMRKLPKNTFVHCHIRGYRAIPFYLIAKKNGLKRFGIHAHTTGLPEEINSGKNKAIRKINNILAKEKVSCGIEASKYIFGEEYVEKKSIMHIPNSIDPQLFLEPIDIDKASLFGAEHSDKFIIGHIGRFRSVKNHMFMLSIVEQLAKSSFDFLWVFAGDGDDFEKIKAITTEKNLDKYVKFLGRRNDIPELLQVMDLFVLPSQYEGFPTVAVEAQASGTKTLLSETITKEVDLQLGLVDFLPIDDFSLWAEHILNNPTTINTTAEMRLERLKDKKLTNKEAAELYQAFLKNEMTHYALK